MQVPLRPGDGGQREWLVATASSRAAGDGVGGLVLSLSGVNSRKRVRASLLVLCAETAFTGLAFQQAVAMTDARIWRSIPASYTGPEPVQLADGLRLVEEARRKANAERQWAAAMSAELARPPVPAELARTSHAVVPPGRDVLIFWDLDNKKPYAAQCPPRALAAALRAVGGRFGMVVDIQAFANRHAFTWTSPFQAAIDEAEREELALHRGGICPLCGRHCGDPETLRKHFAKLHEREARKREAFAANRKRRPSPSNMDKEFRYREAKREVMRPSTGNAAAWSLRREGVHVQRVASTPQAADVALRAAVEEVLKQYAAARESEGRDLTVVVVSDDADFMPLLRRAAKQPGVHTALVSNREPTPVAGDTPLAWIPWPEVVDLATRIDAAGPRALDAAWEEPRTSKRGAWSRTLKQQPSDSPLASWSTVSLTEIADADSAATSDTADVESEEEAELVVAEVDDSFLSSLEWSSLQGTVRDPNAPWRDPSTIDTATQLAAAMAGVLGPPEALDVLYDDGDDFSADAQQTDGDVPSSLTGAADSVVDAATQMAVQKALEHAQPGLKRSSGEGRTFTTRRRPIK